MSNGPIQAHGKCPFCGTEAAIWEKESEVPTVVNCMRCGQFNASHDVVVAWKGHLKPTAKQTALVSHFIRSLQQPNEWPEIGESLLRRALEGNLPRPAEQTDNLLLYLASRFKDKHGTSENLSSGDPAIQATVGVIGNDDLMWAFAELYEYKFLKGALGKTGFNGTLSLDGWKRADVLRRSQSDSRYAFFARQFNNTDLDTVFEKCLAPAILQTGFELRTVTQCAGLVDAIIEDEIRRSRFVIADLSDDNPGAYWEAGFAEGLGKPVIYICKEKHDAVEKSTHFDTNHRHTVRWDLAALDKTAKQLKAVVRNTLLGAANQKD